MDLQSDGLHEAEREFYGKRLRCRYYGGKLLQKEATKLIEATRKLYCLPRVVLQVKKLRDRKAQAWVVNTTNDDGTLFSATITCDVENAPLNAQTLLHELAHVVVEKYFGDVEDHGPEFVGVLSWLFDYFKIIPQDAFGVILRRHKIKRKRVTLCSPQALKSRQ